MRDSGLGRSHIRIVVSLKVVAGDLLTNVIDGLRSHHVMQTDVDDLSLPDPFVVEQNNSNIVGLRI